MDAAALDLATRLRHELHACPERSGEEKKTRALLKAFLREHTTLELYEEAGALIALHREGASETVALRADIDALPLGEGAAHLCGHDGHAAALCGVALAIEGQRLGRNVLLLFQPAEETGAGAEPCCPLLAREHVSVIYGAHNLPGYPLGEVLTRTGTFACASLGMTLRFRGAPAHAAYPETGVSPARAVGELLCAVPEFSESRPGEGLVLCTVIGVDMGEKAFGKSASEADVWLTLRAEKNAALQRLRSSVTELARASAARDGLALGIEEQDVFPAVENTPAYAEHILEACEGQLLPSPMRWSEDFGQYLLHFPGAFFGIGAGEEHPALHTADYAYPDALLGPTADAFLRILGATV